MYYCSGNITEKRNVERISFRNVLSKPFNMPNQNGHTKYVEETSDIPNKRAIYNAKLLIFLISPDQIQHIPVNGLLTHVICLQSKWNYYKRKEKKIEKVRKQLYSKYIFEILQKYDVPPHQSLE